MLVTAVLMMTAERLAAGRVGLCALNFFTRLPPNILLARRVFPEPRLPSPLNVLQMGL
jgi:hypothetical protein